MGGVDRQFAGQVIDGHHGNVFFSRERGMDVKASGMDVIEGISDRRRPPGGRNRPVNIAGDVGDGANPEVGVAGIFRGEEDRGLRIPEGGAYEQVGMGQKTAEGAPVLRGMVEEVEQVEGAPFLVFVVVARVEADEYRKVAFSPERYSSGVREWMPAAFMSSRTPPATLPPPVTAIRRGGSFTAVSSAVSSSMLRHCQAGFSAQSLWRRPHALKPL